MLPRKRLEILQNKKTLLAKKIEKEEHRPYFDTTALRHLKKKKLELSEIIQGIREDSHASG